MNKKKIIIIISYLISLLIFSIIAELNTDRFIYWYMETMDYGNMLLTLVPSIMAEFLHIFITIIIAIILKFNKNVDLEIKRLFYKLPIITIFLWLPIAILSSRIVF
jgi:hypothetical protein